MALEDQGCPPWITLTCVILHYICVIASEEEIELFLFGSSSTIKVIKLKQTKKQSNLITPVETFQAVPFQQFSLLLVKVIAETNTGTNVV